MPAAFNLNIQLTPSQVVVYYLIVLHCLAGLALCLWLPEASVLIVVVFSAHGVWVWQRYVVKLPSRLHFTVDSGRWQLEYENSMREVTLDSVTIWPWVLVFQCREPTTKTTTFLVMKDSCHNDDFRRLRIVLNTHKAFSSSE